MPGACFQGSVGGVTGAASASGEEVEGVEGRGAGGASMMISTAGLANLSPGRDSRAQCLYLQYQLSSSERPKEVYRAPAFPLSPA